MAGSKDSGGFGGDGLDKSSDKSRGERIAVEGVKELAPSAARVVEETQDLKADDAMTARYNKAYRESIEQVLPNVGKVSMQPDLKAANETIGPLREAANDKSPPLPVGTIDADALARVAASRAKDAKLAAEELGLNGIEPASERKQQLKLGDDEIARRAISVKGMNASNSEQGKVQVASAPANNQVVSDEVFTAQKAEVKPIVPPEIEAKYLRVGDKYYNPKSTDVVAFEDKGNKLETRSNSEQIAEAMVTIARARGWDEIKVTGSETFRKEVWLEASAQGMSVKGYTATEIDKAELAKRTRNKEINQVQQDVNDPSGEASKQPTLAKALEAPDAKEKKLDAESAKVSQLAKDRAQAFANKPQHEALKEYPELAGTFAAMVSMEKKAQEDNLTAQQQVVVSGRIRQNIVNSIERGELPNVLLREQTEAKRERKEERELTR